MDPFQNLILVLVFSIVSAIMLLAVFFLIGSLIVYLFGDVIIWIIEKATNGR